MERRNEHSGSTAGTKYVSPSSLVKIVVYVVNVTAKKWIKIKCNYSLKKVNYSLYPYTFISLTLYHLFLTVSVNSLQFRSSINPALPSTFHLIKCFCHLIEWKMEKRIALTHNLKCKAWQRKWWPRGQFFIKSKGEK